MPRLGERQETCSTSARKASASLSTVLQSQGASKGGRHAPCSPPTRGKLEAQLCPRPRAQQPAPCGPVRADSPAGHGTWHDTTRVLGQAGMLAAGQHVPPSVGGQELPRALLGGAQQREEPRGRLLAPPAERLGHERRSRRLPPQHWGGSGRPRGTPSRAGTGRGVARGGQAAAVSAATRSPRDGQRGSGGSDGCTWPGLRPARPHRHPSGTRIPAVLSARDGPALSHRGVTAGAGSCHRCRGC